MKRVLDMVSLLAAAVAIVASLLYWAAIEFR